VCNPASSMAVRMTRRGGWPTMGVTRGGTVAPTPPTGTCSTMTSLDVELTRLVAAEVAERSWRRQAHVRLATMTAAVVLLLMAAGALLAR
jgi:hypothetical protein